jgi:hypothetical protein
MDPAVAASLQSLAFILADPTATASRISDLLSAHAALAEVTTAAEEAQHELERAESAFQREQDKSAEELSKAADWLEGSERQFKDKVQAFEAKKIAAQEALRRRENANAA